MGVLNVLTTTHWWPLGPSPIDTPGVALGRAAGRIEAAAPDPTDGDVMYLGSDNGGVWKTGTWRNTPQTNVPPTWLPVSDGQPSLDFAGYHPLVVHPANADLVLGLVSGTGAGVLKSTNAGLGWQLLGNGLFEGATLGSIAVHPGNTQVLYASVWNGGPGGGVYKSTDGGLNWQNTTPFHGGDVSDVIVAKWDPHVLFAGLVAGDALATGTAGVWRSTDAGANWKRLGGTGLASDLFVGEAIRLESATTPGFAYCAAFENQLDGSTIVGRHRTRNSGDSWEPLATTSDKPEPRPWHLLLAVDSRDGEHILANDAYSLYESTDAGESWTRIDIGIGDDWVNATFDRDSQVVATADRNTYRYDSENKTWVSQEGNLQVTEFWDITLDPTNPDVIYGVAQDHLDPMKFDTFNPWSYMTGGGDEFGKVLVDPDTPQLIYASDPNHPGSLVRRSADGGQTWTTIMSTDDFEKEEWDQSRATQKSFVMDPSKPSRLLLGITRIYEIADAGSGSPSVSVYSEPLSPSGTTSDRWITALAISSDGETVYAATGDGHVWVKRPQKFWEERDKGLFDVGAGRLIDLRLDPKDSDRAFAVTGWSGGVWQLSDGPIPSWTNVAGNLPKNLRPVSIYVDWQSAVVSLYVGTDRGVYRSVDLGQHWTKHGSGMPNTMVSDLQGFPAHNVLAAGTFGRGLWEILITPSRIKGWIFEDADGNGIAGDDARGMPDVKVYLDVDEDGAHGPLDIETTTDPSGHFVFENVPPGTYDLRQLPPAGYAETTSPRRVTVAGSDVRVGHIGIQLRPDLLRERARFSDPSDLNALPGRKPGEPLSGKDELEQRQSERQSPPVRAPSPPSR